MGFYPYETQFRNWGEVDQQERSGVQGNKARWGDFLARGMSPFLLYLPHPAKCPIHAKQTREIFGEQFRSERGFQIPFHHFGRYLPAFLAKPCLLEPFIQCRRENAIPPLHYCSLPRKMMT